MKTCPYCSNSRILKRIFKKVNIMKPLPILLLTCYQCNRFHFRLPRGEWYCVNDPKVNVNANSN